MATITRPNSYSAGATILSAQVNSDFNTIYNDYNGNITNANLSASAAIVDTKLAQISTAGKVSVAALTVSSQATGDLIYASSASAWARLAVGTSSQVLIGGTNPAYGSVPVAAMPSGSIVQSKITQSSAVAQSTGTAVDDDTVPQLTETPVITALNTAITASSGSNTLILTAILNLSVDSSANVGVISVFLDAGTSAIAATRWLPSTAATDLPIPCMIQFSISAVDTSAHTYKVGIGMVTGNAITINGQDNGRKLGGFLFSSLRIDEVKA